MLDQMSLLLRFYCVVFCTFFIVRNCDTAPVNSNISNSSSTSSVTDFMKKYGYLEGGSAESLYQESAMTDAISTLQKFGNIPITGQLDDATIKLMTSPRCGVPDIIRKDDVQNEEHDVI